MEQLMDKLVKAKAIMDMTETNVKSQNKRSAPMSEQSYNLPPARYNIPKEFISESQPVSDNYIPSIPNTKPVGVPTVDAIKNSKLPEEIKRLMIEHPITQAQQPQTTLSNELIEKASRLMKGNMDESKNSIEQRKPEVQPSDFSNIKKMIKEAVNEALKENGLITESSEKSNEIFTFKVGKHVFEGKVTKIKKIA